MPVIECRKCGESYGYDMIGLVYPGGKDREEAACPYCGKVGFSRMTSQSIVVYELE